MAPEIALQHCVRLAERVRSTNGRILDPMAGSGTVLRVAAESGLSAVGFDMDPLAALLSAVWTSEIDLDELHTASEKLIEAAADADPEKIHLPWIDDDEETRKFIDFWFGPVQQQELRVLSWLLLRYTGSIGAALRVALSRLIITKDRGASLAADVSHSRPHKVFAPETHDYEVVPNFRRSVAYVSRHLTPHRLKVTPQVRIGDARDLPLDPGSVTAIITSPPYLNAIDYLRGHRLSLVWLGHSIPGLRTTRSDSIGAERRPNLGADLDLAKRLADGADAGGKLDARRKQMVHRYALDVHALLLESFRVLVEGGQAVLVVGDSVHRGVFVSNTDVVRSAAREVGFVVDERATIERAIPAHHRYLPPPSGHETSALGQRMQKETVLTLSKPN